MRIEYDSKRDLLYIYFADLEAKAAKTVTVTPGFYADFDRSGKLIGIEILDASEVMGDRKEIAIDLIPKAITSEQETISIVRDKHTKR